MSGIRIASAVPAHLGELPRIELAAAARFPAADLPTGIRYQSTDPAELRKALQEKRLWVATDGTGTISGFAMTDIVDAEGYLVELNVLPNHGRQGIGAQLVDTAIDWARSQGLACLWLITFRHLPWNAPFYEKLGFSIVEPAEHGVELAGLIAEEAQLGINTGNRVAMRISC